MRCLLLTLIALFAAAGCKPKASEIRCGGPMNFRCPSDMYCEMTNNCGGLDQEGICRSRPIQCKGEDKPVCGCDGQSYANSCFAAAKGVSIRSSGKCAEPSITESDESEPDVTETPEE